MHACVYVPRTFYRLWWRRWKVCRVTFCDVVGYLEGVWTWKQKKKKDGKGIKYQARRIRGDIKESILSWSLCQDHSNTHILPHACVDFSFATFPHLCRFLIRHLSSLLSISHSPPFLTCVDFSFASFPQFFLLSIFFYLLLCTFTFSTYLYLYSRNEFSGFSQDSKWKSILIINLSLIFGFFICQSIKVELNWCC